MCTVPPVYDQTMLRRLRIENLVLIREADLELPARCATCSRGETGAGKTIFAQAMGARVEGDAGNLFMTYLYQVEDRSRSR